jgi:hypothetical protein
LSDEEHKPEDQTPVQPLGRDLRREDFTPERMRRIADAAAARGGIPLMSEEARRASLKTIREQVPAGSDAWVFGYGSLMWNPAINVIDSRKAHVRGYHRMFCLTLRHRSRWLLHRRRAPHCGRRGGKRALHLVDARDAVGRL